MKLIIKSQCKAHYAEADYIDGKVLVHTGGFINTTDSYPKMVADVLAKRHDPELVGADGTILKEVLFNSPSTAAQFVTGRSSNGYIAWRPDDKMSLKEYLKQNS